MQYAEIFAAFKSFGFDVEELAGGFLLATRRFTDPRSGIELTLEVDIDTSGRRAAVYRPTVDGDHTIDVELVEHQLDGFGDVVAVAVTADLLEQTAVEDDLDDVGVVAVSPLLAPVAAVAG